MKTSIKLQIWAIAITQAVIVGVGMLGFVVIMLSLIAISQLEAFTK